MRSAASSSDFLLSFTPWLFCCTWLFLLLVEKKTGLSTEHGPGHSQVKGATRPEEMLGAGILFHWIKVGTLNA